VRFSPYSLRTRILGQLTVLILAAMLLIDVLMVKLWERDLIADRVRAGKLVIQALGSLVAGVLADPTRADDPAALRLRRWVAGAGFSDLVVVDLRGNLLLSTGPRETADHEALLDARRGASLEAPAPHFSGRIWGLLWTVPARVSVSGPLISDGRLLGGASLAGDLGPLYLRLARSQKVVLLYILLNALVLLLVGFYLLSRTVVNPIRRLVEITREARLDAPFTPPGNIPRDEIGHLYRSLNLMRRRIDEQHRELESHIARLERTNMELKETQERVLRSEKLASVGRLAAGVAHEIGNPLGIVRGYIDLLKKGGLTDEEEKDALTRAESEVSRAAQIIRHLLDFSRPLSTGRKETDLHELIRETAALIEPQPAMKDRRLGLHLNAGDPEVKADSDLLRQVFLNIMMNAADAVADTPHEAPREGEEDIRVETEDDADRVIVRITDRGPGLGPEELDRIFDPFYTTKPPGKGTGLGLSVCHTIMEAHGGSIRAESRENQGTTVVVEIPRHAKGAGA